MDSFGFGNAVLGATRVLIQSSRQTGRTTALLESLADGDRVVVTVESEARRWRGLLRERGLKVDVIVAPTSDPGRLFTYPTSKGRTVFEHTWIEEFYMRLLSDAGRQIDHLQTELSGFGEAHLQTQKAAEMHLRWYDRGYPEL